MKALSSLVLAATTALPFAAGELNPLTTGEIHLLMVSGQQETELRYRLKNGRMRIDRPGKIIPAPPVNLLDFASGTLRILHPHNGTWQEVPADRLRSPQPGLPAPPPGIGPQQGPAITPPGQVAHKPVEPVEPPRIGPDLPRLPDIPRMPEIPRRTGLPPPGFPPPAGGGERKAPGSHVIPPGFPAQPGQLELKPTGERREIHGYSCTRHVIVLPRDGEMSLWLAAPGLFPPFHLLLDEPPRPRPWWPDRIAALLREKGLFPLLAEWKGEDGRGIVRWEVTKIATGEPGDDSLFEVPESFQQLDVR